jgi:hypothetical protein
MLVKLIVNASLPLYIVDHPDFRSFVNTLDPQFRLASKKRLLYNLLPNVYNRCFNYVKDEVAQVITTSLGCDAWSDPRFISFFATTSSIIDQQWNAKTFLFGCNRFKGRHTATRIFDAYTDITNQFLVNSKVTHNLTDGAANMKRALNKISFMNKTVVDGIIQNYNAANERQEVRIFLIY